MYTLR